MSISLEAAVGRDVPRGTREKLERYVALLLAENSRQNLIARSTIEEVRTRHIIDSAQLLKFAPSQGNAVDIGSGAGLPGIVLAVLRESAITLVEPRRLRADFLQRCAAELELPNVTVLQKKAEAVAGTFDLITARAVASLSDLFASTIHLSHPGTRWVLPKGRNGAKELAEAREAWQGRFHVEPSITEGDAVIIVASQVSAKRKGRG